MSQYSNEINALKARLFDIEKEKEFVTTRLHVFIGMEQEAIKRDAEDAKKREEAKKTSAVQPLPQGDRSL